MERDHTPLNAWLALVGVDLVLTAYFWRRLPMTLAQHFGANGYPNGWAPKEEFVAFFWLMIGGMGGIFFFGPKLLRLLPFAWMNIPHKPYWSARQAQAHDILEAQMNWVGVLASGLLTAVMWIVFDANTKPIPQIDNSTFIALLVVFAVTMIGTLVVLFRRFRPPES